MQFSTKEFYAAVEDAIKKTEIDNTYIAEVTHSNTTALISSKRLYLQVKRADQMFLICAAPFGKGFFVSWWLGEPLNFIKDLIPRIPKIGPALAQWIYRKTFYQMDTDSMFKDCISGCVYEIVERITKEHGSRGLSELDRQSENIPLKDRFN
jgi:hypothetical protein